MSHLINRKPASRIDCLHALMRVLNSRFPTGQTFSMKDAKYSSDARNILEFCTLLKQHPIHGFKYCPFKANPLDKAVCGLTNSIQADTTKQKEVSNTLNALEGLGFLDRKEGGFRITAEGAAFATLEIDSEDLVPLFRRACLRYGPFVGMLGQFRTFPAGVVTSGDLTVGYPKTDEMLEVNGKTVRVSTESARDANVRTRSCLLLWAIAAGFMKPHGIEAFPSDPQVRYRQLINADIRASRKFDINLSLYEEFLQSPHRTERPLDYSNLTKNVGSLRENGQALQRDVTMAVDSVIKNRRFAICFALNRAAERSENVDVGGLVSVLAGAEDMFAIPGNDVGAAVRRDLQIGFVAGIPFEAANPDSVMPICSLDLEVLSAGVPIEVVNYLKVAT